MSNSDSKRLFDQLFAPGQPLHDLARRAAEQSDLTGWLRAVMAGDLRAHLLAGNLREDGTLVVLTDSPAWAARLRFEGEVLLDRCRELHPQTQGIKVRVAGPGGPGGTAE